MSAAAVSTSSACTVLSHFLTNARAALSGAQDSGEYRIVNLIFVVGEWGLILKLAAASSLRKSIAVPLW
jgi:hypothetical protein